jgi:hypothetical protein
MAHEKMCSPMNTVSRELSQHMKNPHLGPALRRGPWRHAEGTSRGRSRCTRSRTWTRRVGQHRSRTRSSPQTAQQVVNGRPVRQRRGTYLVSAHLELSNVPRRVLVGRALDVPKLSLVRRVGVVDIERDLD